MELFRDFLLPYLFVIFKAHGVIPENPYAAPKTESSVPSINLGTSSVSPYGPYREVSSLRFTILVLLAGGVLAALAQIFTLVSINQTSFSLESEETGEYWLELSGQLAILEVIFYLTTVLVWCFWKNRSSKNAWLFKSAQPSSSLVIKDDPSPGWAVGYYFIPILNLWKPFQAMAFIRDQVSSKISIGPILGIWWTTWIVMNFSTNYFTRSTDNITTIEEAVSYNEGLMIDSGLTILASLTAAAVIHFLTNGQRLIAKELGHLPER